MRCGQCRTELELAGPGEFLCPACGTRNVVRAPGGPAPADLGGISVPGGAPPAAPPTGDANVRWERCPSCVYRFAMGEVERVTCPSCGTELEVTESGVRAVQA